MDDIDRMVGKVVTALADMFDGDSLRAGTPLALAVSGDYDCDALLTAWIAGWLKVSDDAAAAVLGRVNAAVDFTDAVVTDTDGL